MVKQRTVIVKKHFDISGREYADYIRQNSEKNALKFINEVSRVTEKVVLNPTAYPEERYLVFV